MSPFHFCLSAAKNLSSFQLLPVSLITDLLQLFLGLPLFLFPWGFQSRAAFGISPSSFLNVWPMHLNVLFRISKFNTCHVRRGYKRLECLWTNKQDGINRLTVHLLGYSEHGRGRMRSKCDDTRAETRFRLSTKGTRTFKSSVQSTNGSRGVRISGSNATYTMFRGSV